MLRKKVMHSTDNQYIVVIIHNKKYLLMHDLKANFEKFYHITKEYLSQELNEFENVCYYANRPRFSDCKVIALGICCEALGIDSENYFWSKLTNDYENDFPDLMHRTNFNRRRKRLSEFIHRITERISAQFNLGEDTYILDSIPVPICKLARERRCKICRDSFETAPDKGYTASLEKWFYGYKLQLVTSVRGIFTCMELTKASLHDIHYLNELRYEPRLKSSTVIADRGYLSAPKQMELFESCGITLVTPMRRGQRNYQTFPLIFKKSRRRIETLFSQLCDQMMLKRNYAKSFNGVASRIICKIAAVTMLQLINYQNNRSLNHLKHALAA